MNKTSLAMLLLVIGNALALISDAFVKEFSSEVSVAQFVLIRSIITLGFLTPFVFRTSIHKLKLGWKVQAIRAQVSVFGTLCMVISLNYLTLATANAIFYAAPVIVMTLAVLVYREKLTVASLTAVIFGFAGVLLILRPGALQWPSLAALGVAFSLAINVLLIRKLPREQNPMQMLFVMHILMLPVLTLFSLFYWQPVSAGAWKGALGSSVFILFYNVTVLFAYRLAEANRITSTEYTGMVWAILVGWLLFDEVPDLPLIIGSAMIVLPLVWIAFTEKRMIKMPEEKTSQVAEETSLSNSQ